MLDLSNEGGCIEEEDRPHVRGKVAKEALGANVDGRVRALPWRDASSVCALQASISHRQELQPPSAALGNVMVCLALCLSQLAIV